MKRIGIFIYGVLSYAAFVGTAAYGVGFVGNLWVPKSIDSPAASSLAEALIVNFALLAVFAIQHSVMARPGFKRWWTRIVPEPAERSTYVLLSSLALILLFWQWRPMGGVIWNVEDPIAWAFLYALFAFGWIFVLGASFLINHFDLFGLRQVYLHLRGREFTPLKFGTPGIYRYIRHPLYVGWMMAFWATPTMSAAHLLFAVGTTLYILVAIVFEEGDLLKFHGPEYAAYRSRTPMFIPRIFGGSLAGQTLVPAQSQID